MCFDQKRMCFSYEDVCDNASQGAVVWVSWESETQANHRTCICMKGGRKTDKPVISLVNTLDLESGWLLPEKV